MPQVGETGTGGEAYVAGSDDADVHKTVIPSSVSAPGLFDRITCRSRAKDLPQRWAATTVEVFSTSEQNPGQSALGNPKALDGHPGISKNPSNTRKIARFRAH